MYQESVKNHHRLVTGVDRQVGRIVEKLREKGLDKNTIILYTGDNGYFLGERGFAHKWLAYELSIRVPLVIFDPLLPADRRGKRLDQMALSIDLAPTVLDVAGVPIPERMQGKSLLPLLEGKDVPWRTEFFYEHLFAPDKIAASEAVRDQRYKYIRYVKTDPPYEELYDLRTDPDEATNLAGKPEHRQTLETMRTKWAEWRERAK
jgi:arylsulfatase A-like enzyme